MSIVWGPVSRSRRAAVPWGEACLVTALLAVAGPVAFAQQPPAAAPASGPPAEVTFYGNPTAAISSGVVIPAGRASVWVSGTTPPVIKADAPAGSPERFGDTKTQAAGILKTIETQLAARGLTMKDVVYIRAYLVPDPQKEKKIDLAGWNAAYGEVFGTATNPTKTARSTVGVLARSIQIG